MDEILEQLHKRIADTTDTDLKLLLAKQAILLGDAIDLAYGVDSLTSRALALIERNK